MKSEEDQFDSIFEYLAEQDAAIDLLGPTGKPISDGPVDVEFLRSMDAWLDVHRIPEWEDGTGSAAHPVVVGDDGTAYYFGDQGERVPFLRRSAVGGVRGSLSPSKRHPRWRGDAQLLAHFSERYGSRVAEARIRLPLFDVSSVYHKYAAIELDGGYIERMRRPYDDFLIDHGFHRPGRFSASWMRTWDRVTTVGHLLDSANPLAPWARRARQPLAQFDADCAVIESAVYWADEHAFSEELLLTVLYRDGREDRLWRCLLHHDAAPSIVVPEAGDAPDYIGGLAVRAMIYVSRCPEAWVVETHKPQEGKAHKAHLSTPWQTEEWSRIVLFDPTTTTVHMSNHHGGHHAPPVPHSRRAHSAILLHPRFYRYSREVIARNPALPPLDGGWKIEDSFRSGIDEAGEPRVFKRKGNLWEEHSVRRCDHPSIWIGPTEWRGPDGTVYRVISRDGD